MKNNTNLIEKIYIVIIQVSTKTAYIKQKTEKNVKVLGDRYKANIEDFYKPLKIRALSTDEAFVKACKALEIEPKEFTIDKSRIHQLTEIEEFIF